MWTLGFVPMKTKAMGRPNLPWGGCRLHRNARCGGRSKRVPQGGVHSGSQAKYHGQGHRPASLRAQLLAVHFPS